MKKIFSFFAVLVLIFSLSACQRTPDTTNSGSKTGNLADDGMKVISLMNEMLNNDEYGLMVLSNYSKYVEIINAVRRGNYSQPTAVYELKMDIRMVIGAGRDGFSEALDRYVDSMANASVASYINSAESIDGVAVSSLFSANVAFVDESVKEDAMYLYVFEDGYPIFVNFTCGEDGAVRASGSFIMNIQLYPDSADNIEQFFADSGFRDCKVKKIS